MKGILQRGFREGLKLTWTLGKVIFPVTLIVSILEYTPLLKWMIDFIAPAMGLIGLSGEAAIPLVLGNFLNLYAAIGAIITIDFTVKEVFILAVMLSFCHNLIIESTVAAKVGVRFWVVVGVRLMLALISGILINLFWQGGSEMAQYGMKPETVVEPDGWLQIGWEGLTTAFFGVLQLALIVIPLMIVMQYLREKGWMAVFTRWMTPATKVLGMKPNTSSTLVAGLTIGLAYGAGVMIQAVKDEGVSKKDMYLALIFLVSCHAVIEDTLIFVPLGIPVLPLLGIRLVTAVLLTMTVATIWRQLEKQKGKETSHEHSYTSL